MPPLLSTKTWLALAALIIVGATLLYTGRLARELAREERKDVAQWVEAVRISATGPETQDYSFQSRIIAENTTIPVIMTDEDGAILSHVNFSTGNSAEDSVKRLQEKLTELKDWHRPIVSDFGSGKNYVYYGESALLRQLRFFPYVQLLVIILFLTVVLMGLASANRAIQNQVWVGLSKETAHQLGTPLSSIEGWLELLSDREENAEAVSEAKKDLDRLKLVADRFSKVGSAPKPQRENLVARLEDMVAYMQRRAPAKVSIRLHSEEADMPVLISGPLFDWVIENLIRNALDAMDGRGSIDLVLAQAPESIVLDVSDTGKGMTRGIASKIFNPGFSTKKRGWGLGLSLSKRIVEQYHRGSLTVLRSEVGKGTTFRIVLRQD